MADEEDDILESLDVDGILVVSCIVVDADINDPVEFAFELFATSKGEGFFNSAVV